MLPKVPTKKSNTRLLTAISEKLKQDPIALCNLSAFIRVTVDAFIARGATIESTRALSLRHECKTNLTTTAFSVPAPTLTSYQNYAANQGASVGALILSALCLHYFGAAPAPVPAASSEEPVRGAKQHRMGWRQFILSLAVGQTHDVCLRDRDAGNTRRAIHNTAAAMRDGSHPSLQITSRLTSRTLSVTRLC